MKKNQVAVQNNSSVAPVERKRFVLGRPRMWATPEDMKKVIQEYFDETPEMEITVTGLALAIGTSRNVLIEYEKREGYAEIIRDAKLRVENSYERSLRRNGRTGDIFALKNFGWVDRTETDVTTKGKAINPVAVESRAKDIVSDE